MHQADRREIARRAKMRSCLLGIGFGALALAALFLSFGRRMLELEFRVAWVIIAGLAAAGIAIIFAATLVYGRRSPDDVLDLPRPGSGRVIRR